ncbi:Tetratricopeptide repeat protein [Rubripirellula lacrimiformis]|uniref:Tetratricopeptide repeat protein n=2 Tax=Rubripirellula lacrimiformis TaxID=1930273 RepID=A0A517NC84_9BACT|nr:Tetratricopeptide repeat protein [Rubripirellula lacrimiformis]
MFTDRRLPIALAAMLFVQAASEPPGGCVAIAADDFQGDTEVTQLIEQLGAASYATRSLAMERLQRMGLEAFDKLNLAQFHPDIEIEMAARYLVSSLIVSWSKDSDPQVIRDTLHEYGAQSESERTSRIEMLAEFPDRQGLPALVRLAKFETSLRLSRVAALTLMQQKMHSDPSERSRSAELINEGLGNNQRQASEWLRVYAKDLAAGEYSAERWRQLIQQQRDQMDSPSLTVSSRESVLELVQICAMRAIDAGQREVALSLARENIDLIVPATRNITDACSWAIDHQLHPFVLDLRDQFRPMFDPHPVLLYGAAEAEKVAGNDERASELADLALSILPLPRTEEEKKAMTPKEIEDTAQAHVEIGMSLQKRGLFFWAEREYRKVIDAEEIGGQPSAVVRDQLASMLAELQRHEEVVAVLTPLIERVDKDDDFKQQLNRIFFRYNHFRSEVLYHGALAKIKTGHLDEARPLLTQAYTLSPSNIDILITMYRTDGDEEWRRHVKSKLDAAVRRAASQVQTAEMQVQGQRQMGLASVAELMNQYAWLISNTEGDKQLALEYSLKSLELDADGAKYDTCGRCYFAIGDYDNAIRMQKRAIKLVPHSPPLERQLKEFESAREAAEAQQESP